jgi:hypothetical protein
MNNNMLMESHKNIVKSYIRAKDDNKPHMMKAIFSGSATLEMKVKTEHISFPANSSGLDAIIDVLVKSFSQSYENVYTFCLINSIENQEHLMSCDWLVCMTAKEGGDIRVGCGRYDWSFSDDNKLTNHLVISIEQMSVLPPEYSNQIMGWIEKVPYPFCNSIKMLELMPDLDGLALVRKYFS